MAVERLSMGVNLRIIALVSGIRSQRSVRPASSSRRSPFVCRCCICTAEFATLSPKLKCQPSLPRANNREPKQLKTPPWSLISGPRPSCSSCPSLHFLFLPEQVPEQDHAMVGGVRDHLHTDGQAVELEGHDGGHQERQPLLPRHIRGRREKACRMVSFVLFKRGSFSAHN